MSWRIILLAAALGGSSPDALAITPVWQGTTSAAWNDSTNWASGVVPSVAGDQAVLGIRGSAQLSPLITDIVVLDSITFDVGAPSYSLQVQGTAAGLNFVGDGILNYSILPQTLTVGGTAALDVSGDPGADYRLNFYKNATAGNATLVALSGGIITFRDYSSAGDATLQVKSGGGLYFVGVDGVNSPSGGRAHITVDAGGIFDMGGTGLDVGSIAGGGTFELGGQAGSILVTGSDGTSTTVSGTLISSRGNGGLTKTGTGTLTLSGVNTYTGGTRVQDAGTLVITKGGQITQTSYVEAARGGTLRVDGAGGGGSVTATDSVFAGTNGSKGTLEILNGGKVETSGGAVIGYNKDAVGMATVDGAGSTLSTKEGLDVGFLSGRGTLKVQNGGKVESAGGLGIGSFSSVGTVMVDGAGSAVSSAASVIAGYQGGTGTLNILKGGKLETTDGTNGTIYVGYSNGTGTATVDGTGSTLTSGEGLRVGTYSGTGTLNIREGGKVEIAGGHTSYIGFKMDSVGTVTVAGAGSNLVFIRDLGVGAESSTGTLNIREGGSVSAGEIFIGLSAGMGTVTVDGEDSVLTTDVLVLGENGEGVLTLQNGGTATVDGGTGEVSLGGIDGSGTLNIGGVSRTQTAGTLQAAQVVGDGNATVNFNQTDTTTFSAKLTGFLNVNQNGPGTTILSAANDYFGYTAVNGGTLVLDYTASGAQMLEDRNALTFLGGTLQLDRSADATGTQQEDVGGTYLFGAGNITRGAGSTAVINLGDITVINGSLNVSGDGIATTNTANNTSGILGYWATVGGSAFAKNATNGLNGAIVAYTGYADVTRLTSGPQVITSDAESHVRIVLGSGSKANITLGSTVTQIDTLTQSAYGSEGNQDATLDLAGKTLQVNAILVASGAGRLTLGTEADSGQITAVVVADAPAEPAPPPDTFTTTLAAPATQEVVLQVYGDAGLQVNSAIVDNGAAVSLRVLGTRTATLSGTNTYTGDTNIIGGTVSVTASGTINQTGNLNVNSGGSLTVEGGVTALSGIHVGQGSQGTLTLQNGGAVESMDVFVIGSDGGSGLATVTGKGSLLTASALTVGGFGTGVLNIQDGATGMASEFNLGNGDNAVGTATVTGAGSILNIDGFFQVGAGEAATGMLNIQNGGRVEVADVNAYIGNFSGTGTVTVDGEGSALNIASKELRMGFTGGTGTLNLQNGGSVQIGDDGDGQLVLGYSGTGTLNIGSADTPGTAGSLLASQVTSMNKIDSASRVNFNQTDTIDFAPIISGGVHVSQNGPGTTVFATFNNNSYTGTTEVHAGTLVVNGTLSGTSAVTVDVGATLAGGGIIGSSGERLPEIPGPKEPSKDPGGKDPVPPTGFITDMTINLNGTLSVGDPTAETAQASSLTIFAGRGSVIMGARSLILVDLFSGAGEGDNTENTSASDRVRLGGTLNATAGGTLVIGNPETMTSFAEGDAWQLFELNDGKAGLNGFIQGDLTLDFSALHLSKSLTGSFDFKSGIFSIIANTQGPATHWLGGGTDGKWSSANWASDISGTTTTATPTADDDITFSATGATGATQTVLDQDFTIKSLTVLAEAQVGISGTGPYDLHVVNDTTVGGVLSLNSDAFIVSGGTFTVSENGILAGDGGGVDMAVDQNLRLNGVLNVGNADFGAASFALSTSGTGAVVMGSGSLLLVDVWTGAGLGDNTANASASDRIELEGRIDATSGGTLVVSNPAHLTGFAGGDKWKVVELLPGSSITGTLALNTSGLGLTATQTTSFDQSTGVLQVVDTQSGLETAAVQDQSLVSSMQGALSDINGRLFSLRAGGGEEAAGSIAEATDEGVILGQGDGPEDGPVAQKRLRSREWEVYTTVNYANIRLNTIGTQAGVKSYSWSPGIGIERHVSRRVAVGLALSLLETHQTYSAGLGTLDMQGVAFSAYASYVSRALWMDVLYSFGSIELDTQRNAVGFPAALGSAYAYTNALQLNGGWNFRFQDNRLVTGPFLGVDYLNVAVDGYTESGGGAGALSYASRSTDSLVTRVGWSLSRKFATNFGSVTPQLRVSYERQNLTSNNGTSVNLVNQPFTTTTNSQHPGQDYLVAGAGVNFQLSPAFNLMLTYSGQFFRENMQAHYVGLRFGYQF